MLPDQNENDEEFVPNGNLSDSSSSSSLDLDNDDDGYINDNDDDESQDNGRQRYIRNRKSVFYLILDLCKKKRRR